ncbi:MAG: NIPSNAP family protein [Acidobacteria bacterium]|nr:NIPSNAP family protein [Acidobacteriota bacterium]
MLRNHIITVCLATAAFVAVLYVDDRAVAQANAKARVFELRTYTAADGRMEALLDRFRNHSMGLLKKHGIESIAYWVAVDDPQTTLVYIVAHPNREAAAKSWKEFGDDPEWKAVVQETQKEGALTKKIDRLFLEATDFSPMK